MLNYVDIWEAERYNKNTEFMAAFSEFFDGCRMGG